MGMRTIHGSARLAAAGSLLLLVAGAIAPSVVHAEEKGFVAGDLLFQPSIRLDVGYDTNVFYENDDEDPNASLKGEVTPGLKVSTPKPRALDVQGNASVTWDQYISGDEATSKQSGLQADAGIGVRINPLGNVSLRPYDKFRRISRASYVEDGEPFSVVFNEAGLELGWHPGGADRASRMGFSGRLLGFHRLYSYEEADGIDKDALGGLGEVKWHFLPKSAVFLQTQVDSTSYDDAERKYLGGAGISVANSDSFAYRLRAGLASQLTRSWSLSLGVGYGGASYDTGDDAGRVLASIKSKLDLTETFSWSVGYHRDFVDSTFSNYVVKQRAETGFAFDNKEMAFGIGGFATFSDFAPLSVDPALLSFSTASRSDLLIGGNGSFQVKFNDWLRSGITYNLLLNDSNLEVVRGAGSSSVPTSYVKHRVMIGAEAGF